MKKDSKKISAAYSNLWTAFCKTNEANAKFDPIHFSPKYEYISERKILKTKDNTRLQIIGWPMRLRGLSSKVQLRESKKKYDIHIEINQKIEIGSQKKPLFISSGITVTYLEHIKSLSNNAPQECKIYGSIRYDFSVDQQGHPIYHAHVGDNPIDQDISNRTYLNKILPIKNLRIPTPPMDLKAVLIGLVADNCSSKLKDLTTTNLWKNAENDLPCIPIDFLKKKIDDTGRIDSLQWYIEGDSKSKE